MEGPELPTSDHVRVAGPSYHLRLLSAHCGWRTSVEENLHLQLQLQLHFHLLQFSHPWCWCASSLGRCTPHRCCCCCPCHRVVLGGNIGRFFGVLLLSVALADLTQFVEGFFDDDDWGYRILPVFDLSAGVASCDFWCGFQLAASEWMGEFAVLESSCFGLCVFGCVRFDCLRLNYIRVSDCAMWEVNLERVRAWNL